MRSDRRLAPWTSILLFAGGLAPCAARSSSAAGWPTDDHDARRTAQSEVRGPAAAAPPQSIVLDGGSLINIPTTIAADGTLFTGTWGLVHDQGSTNEADWTKDDGKVYAFDRELGPVWPSPFPGDVVPYCYVYDGRTQNCGSAPGTINGYNGTVEGTGALSSGGATLYVGRGDGKLYALDTTTGTELWSVASRNPLLPDDPEGGGEVIAGPVVGGDGTIYFATVAVGPYETSAIYAVSSSGELLWRYPEGEASWRGTFFADPALSPDGSTLYVASAWGPSAGNIDGTIQGALLAFDIAAESGNGDERLRWSLDLVDDVAWWHPAIWPMQMAVGADGTIYLGGGEPIVAGTRAVVIAIDDLGSSGALVWDSPAIVPSYLVEGLALREEGGVTTRVYASTGRVYDELSQSYPPGGVLDALDPADGSELWPEPFDPEQHGGTGAMTGIALGADGTIYTGVSGATANGQVYAIGPDGALVWQAALDGTLEWSQPVLGPAGDLYVGDGGDIRRCLFDIYPVELGLCDALPDDPRLYRFAPALFLDGFESGDDSAWTLAVRG